MWSWGPLLGGSLDVVATSNWARKHTFSWGNLHEAVSETISCYVPGASKFQVGL